MTIYRNIISILAFFLVLYLTLDNTWNYLRLPTIPLPLRLAEVAALVETGERPLVALTDAQWDCKNIYVRRGKSRWVTDVALKTDNHSPPVVAHFWSKEDCQSVTDTAIAGVLEPIGRFEYTNLQEHGIKFPATTTSSTALHLCVTCNKDYYWHQMSIFLLCLLAVTAVNFTLFREFWRRWVKRG